MIYRCRSNARQAGLTEVLRGDFKAFRNAWTCSSVARRCQEVAYVDEAVVLAGTNDCMMHMAFQQGNQGMLRVYRALNRLPESYEPSLERFQREFQRLRRGEVDLDLELHVENR